MTLTFVPEGWTHSRHHILDADGRAVGTLDLSNWREAATLVLGEATYAIRLDRIDRAFTVCGPDGLPVAQAHKASAWKPDFALDWGDGRGRLYRPSAWRGGRFVVDGEDGERLVNLERRGVWRPRLHVGTVGDWTLERTAFVAVLMLFVLRAEAAAAAS